MDFRQVVRMCLDFSIANNSSIQSYPAGYKNRLDINSRTSRIDIGVEELKQSQLWKVWQIKNSVGGKSDLEVVTVDSEAQLLVHLKLFWDAKF